MGILDTLSRNKKKGTMTPDASTSPKKAAAKPKPEAKAKTTAKPTSKAAAAPATAGKELAVASVLLQPAMTEKSFRLQAENKYVFFVTKNANKHQVMMAVKQTYGTEPVAVNMVRIRPQIIYRWGREMGMRKEIKKAIVTMPAGTTLPLNTK